jgi:hypothetical protein
VKPNTKLPNFFILGAARAGTASFAHYIDQHPAIWFTSPRDPRFFEKDEMFARGLDYYSRSLCGNVRGEVWRGEASPGYFAKPHLVGPRLRATFGDAPLRFVVLLREPTARAWSHYLYRLNHGYEERDFATALAEEWATPEAEGIYFNGGRYHQLLQAWEQYYAREDFLLLLTEDLAASPHEQVRRAFTWLEVDPEIQVNCSERINQASYTQSRSAMNFLNRPPGWLRTAARRIMPDAWLRNDLRRKLRGGLHKSYGRLPELDPVLADDLRHRYQDEVLAVSKRLGRYLSHWLPDDAKERF